ncbi:FAD-dependent monooxygenase [Kitasatospora sp. NPDC090091]|uniref:FAD-dependent monooxygenase n=1 Tax=Kitasatospora sp. NPDC090091 TaxID=3364081 RepID=UPI0038230884
MRGGSIAVVGGSIAGCAFARAAARGGAEQVVVLERSPGRLEDRGVGLCVLAPRYEELVRAGHLDDGIRHHRLVLRRWLTRETAPADGLGTADPRGRVLWVQDLAFRSYHWGVLWQALRERAPEGVEFRLGEAVTAVDAGAVDGGDGPARVRTTTGGREPYDLVVGADGYRSLVREALCPEAADPAARPAYAGYVCWRGSFDARLLDGLPGGAALWPEDEIITACYPGGQVVLYRIPGLEPGSTQVNWVFYAPTPAWLPLDGPTSVPAGALTGAQFAELAALAERQLPPYWAAVVADLTPRERTFIQPVYDLDVPRRTAGRLLLAGDAASVVRPHNTSGVVKALQDAWAFEEAWRSAGSWTELLSAYERDRGPVGRETVELGRRLGRAQVTEAPDWSVMDGPAMVDWWRRQLGGKGVFGGHALAQPPNGRQAR